MNALLAPTRLTFEVYGIPEPQGSASVFMLNGQPRITTANPKLKAWRKIVARAYQDIVEGPITSPVVVRAEFRFERPPSVPKSRLYPVGREGDVDKLCSRGVQEMRSNTRVSELGGRLTLLRDHLGEAPARSHGEDQVPQVHDGAAEDGPAGAPEGVCGMTPVARCSARGGTEGVG